MTLGRTSSGSIKIKTDEAGGGLRAVECGCCGCGCHIGSNELTATLQSATTGIFDGVEPWSATFYEGGFFLQWDSLTTNADGDVEGYEAIMSFDSASGCIEITIFSSGSTLNCGPICRCEYHPEVDCSKGPDILINGEPVPSYNLIYNPDPAFPLITNPPEFFFS